MENYNMNKTKQEIIKTGKWIMEKQLTWGTSGNLSARMFMACSMRLLFTAPSVPAWIWT